MTEKTIVGPLSAFALLQPMHTVLVSSIGKKGKPNITTLAWCIPTSIDPPLVAISISPKRHAHSLIMESKEFVINIPTIELLKEAFFCGRVSGVTHDKFKESGLTPVPAHCVKPPTIKECIAHVECKLVSQFETGDHTIFIGKIVEAYVSKSMFEKRYNLNVAKMLLHLGGNAFATVDSKIYRARLPTKSK